MRDRITVAIVQTTPVFDDLPACLAILEERTRDAAARGAELVTLGETFLPGYPAWLDSAPAAALWDHEPVKDAYANLRRNSVVVGSARGGSEVTTRLAELAKELGITLVVGIHERVDGGPGTHTLYNALLTFTPDGRLANHHRKLVPTYTERLVWGRGDGRGLRAVDVDGARVTSLVCWEHWMPLARQALHDEGEHVHVAVWPTVHDRHQLASRHYAFEGRCFVLAAGQLGRVRDLPEGVRPAGDPERFVLSGGSAIYGPGGEVVVEPVFEQDVTLVAELDLTRIDAEAMTLDVSGHYHRPDVFDFAVRDRTTARATATTGNRASPDGPPSSRRDP